MKIIKARRADGNLVEVPFIDAMMQNYSSDDKVLDMLHPEDGLGGGGGQEKGCVAPISQF